MRISCHVARAVSCSGWQLTGQRLGELQFVKCDNALNVGLRRVAVQGSSAHASQRVVCSSRASRIARWQKLLEIRGQDGGVGAYGGGYGDAWSRG